MMNDPSGQRHRDLGKLQVGAVSENAAAGALLLRVLFLPVLAPLLPVEKKKAKS
jgi:hypothetical protein